MKKINFYKIFSKWFLLIFYFIHYCIRYIQYSQNVHNNPDLLIQCVLLQLYANLQNLIVKILIVLYK